MRAGVSKDDLVTGEAVVVALPYAGLPLRALSGIIDVVAASVLMVLLAWLMTTLDGLDEALLAAVALLVGVFSLVAFPAICESLIGRTIGKALTGLRTVRSDGAPADPRRVITRHLIGVVEIWLTGGSVALLAGMVTEPTRRLGDIAAGTYVARTRVRPALPPTSPMPPELQQWARSADLGRLPDDLATMIRTSLAQAQDFTTPAATRMDDMLASRAAAYVSPRPPAGTTSRALLHAVMAERRRREIARLEADELRRRRLFDRSALRG